MKKMAAVVIAVVAVWLIFKPTLLAGETQEVQRVEEEQRGVVIVQAQPPEFIAYEDVPLEYAEQIHMQRICKELSVSYEFCLAMMESESTYQEDAVGDGGDSVGRFQINRVNWERMQEEYGLDVHDPMDNIECGVRIIWELFEKYEDPYLVIMCYKCGESRGKDLYSQGIYKNHQFDCEKLCDRAEELERNHGK